LWWRCTGDRKVRGNFQTYGGGKYLTVSAGDGKTEKSLHQPNCSWDERDEDKTHEIPRRRTARSDDGELSLAWTNSGSRCDSKFRRQVIPFPVVSPPTPPLVRYDLLFAVKTLQGTSCSRGWPPIDGSVISQQQQVSLVHNNIIMYYISTVPVLRT